MWIIIIMTLLNAFGNNKTFVLENRIEVAGMPVNMFDGLAALGLIWIVVRPRGSRVPTDRVHPVLFWTLIFYTMGLGSGLLASVSNQATARDLFNTIHNYLSLP